VRGLFGSFGQIYGYYLFLKCDLRGCKTLLPSKTYFNDETFNQRISISIREEKACFIGDVENFLDNLKPWERKIIKFFYTKTGDEFHESPFKWISNWFSNRRRKSNHPPKLHCRQGVEKHFKHLTYFAEGYFHGKGYIEDFSVGKYFGSKSREKKNENKFDDGFKLATKKIKNGRFYYGPSK
jgi:hypothetical protein